MVDVIALALVPYKMWYPARSVTGVPSVFSVGGVQDSVAEPVAGVAAGALTTIANGPIDELLLPLVPVIVMPPLVPSLVVAGLPVNTPVSGSKAAHVG